ncbi:hypothetical protein BVX95_00620 [archaeon D22]|nr:hypothetical protein BVX95_00620 [archaeon D22]
MQTVTIIGLGYVGLPLACLCARKGYNVYGIDLNSEIVNKTNEGISHIDDDDLKKDVSLLKGKIKATNSYEECIPKSNIVIVCVPTPVKENYLPDLKYVESASQSIFPHLKKDQLIVLESTVHPGTCEEIVIPQLNKNGLKLGEDFYFAYCPERIDPGNTTWTIEKIPRVIGGYNNKSAQIAKRFYDTVLEGETTAVSSLKAAEATKIVENTFRDINIAFVNELAMSFDNMDIDIKEVIKGASTKPFAFMPHYPSCGVGGHCIPVDPYYLIEKAKNVGFEHKFLSLARNINNGMPNFTIEKLKELMGNESLENKNIGILGLSYKANIDDMRESPSLKIIEILKNDKANPIVYDPHVLEKSDVETFEELLQKVDYLILCTNHKEFVDMDYNLLKENNIKIIIDGKNCLDKEKLKQINIKYKGIGR